MSDLQITSSGVLAGLDRARTVMGVDPGVKYLGWAVAVDGLIVACGYCSPLSQIKLVAETHSPDLCIIEKPQQYEQSRARRRDVNDLTLAAGEIKALVSAPRTEFQYPREWKGQVPKDIHQARILALMTVSEVSLLPSRKTQRGHVMDACGIVLRHVGRL